MKKLITSLFAAVLLFAAVQTHAQSGYLKRASDSKTTDTLTNAATSNLQLPISGYQSTVEVSAYVTKLTGTTAGTVFLYGSNDGTNYKRIASVKNDGTIGLDSLNLSNTAGVQEKQFKLVQNTGAAYANAYLQIRTVGSGTQSTKIQAYALWRKQ